MPLRSIRIVVGHARTPHRFQIVISLSCTTGYRTPSFFVASTTLSYDFSQKNSGLCTPTIVNPSFSYRSYQPRNCGITLRQLIQPKVQNSTRTTRPRRPGVVKGPLLIQRSPATSGAGEPRREAWPTAEPTARPVATRSTTTTNDARHGTATAFSPSFCRPASSYRPPSWPFRPPSSRPPSRRPSCRPSSRCPIRLHLVVLLHAFGLGDRLADDAREPEHDPDHGDHDRAPSDPARFRMCILLEEMESRSAVGSMEGTEAESSQPCQIFWGCEPP